MTGWNMLGNAWKSMMYIPTKSLRMLQEGITEKENGLVDECGLYSTVTGIVGDLVVASPQSMAKIPFERGSQVDLQAELQAECSSCSDQSMAKILFEHGSQNDLQAELQLECSSGSDQSMAKILFERGYQIDLQAELEAECSSGSDQSLDMPLFLGRHAQGVDMTSDTFDQFLLHDDELLFAVEDMFGRCCPVEALGVSTGALRKMVFATQSRYDDLPNYSFRHAFDVFQATYFLIKCTGFERTATKLELFALLVVALLHDVGHVGGTNIEWYHFCRKLLFSEDGLLPPGCFNDEVRSYVDVMVRECCLSTDPATMNTDPKILDQVMEASSGSFAKSAFRRQVCRLLIRCAYVFHPLRPFYLHRKWALSVANDFSNQGKLQASMGSVPDSMMSQRTYVDSLGTSTIGFINSRVLPLYCRLSALFPDSVQCCNFPSHLKQTCTMWTSYDHTIQSHIPYSMYRASLDILD